MGSADHGRGGVLPAAPGHTDAQPSGVAGFCNSTLSHTADFETDPSDFESQMNKSRNRSSFSRSGARVPIWDNTSNRAPSTPTEKNEKWFDASPALTFSAAPCQ